MIKACVVSDWPDLADRVCGLVRDILKASVALDGPLVCTLVSALGRMGMARQAETFAAVACLNSFAWSTIMPPKLEPDMTLYHALAPLAGPRIMFVGSGSEWCARGKTLRAVLADACDNVGMYGKAHALRHHRDIA